MNNTPDIIVAAVFGLFGLIGFGYLMYMVAQECMDMWRIG